ncbi:AAA family ATPase [Methylobacter sp.]|uniref:AAA family ATPase n=1 Tax=Methylobacter sp. TaxID=2051955 RepID=UPI0024899D89|nr:AAA family ATPase [Methylobacter sp.]MDI1279206.1 AAA family ATPase [Methylobacter sp.]MDI1357763.1 AAA family ATPase [Methylobacter sp.]
MSEPQKTHLHQIKLKGFKSIKALDLKMNPINILIGANGAGKSNFISLFTFLRNLSEGKLQTYAERQGYANTFFHFGSKTTPKIIIDIEIGSNGYHVEFVHGETNDTLVFDTEYCTVYSSSRTWQIKGKLGESGLLPGSEAVSDLVRKYTREYMQGCRVYHFHDTSPTAGFKQAQRLSSNVLLDSNASNLAPFLLYLRDHNQANYQEIISAIKTVAPFFHDFYLEPRGEKGDESLLLRWVHRDHDTPFSANQLSDGTARFICMAVLFLQPEWSRPETIVLDEPELGLHPAALNVLAEMVKTASKQNQVICSTQSVAFANQFEPEDFIVVDQQKGVSTFKRPDKKALVHWLEDYGMGDIWSKNLIGGRPEW